LKEFPDSIITSGDITRHKIMADWQNHNIYHLGEAINRDLLVGLEINLVSSPAEADLIVVSEYSEELELWLAKHLPTLQQALNCNLPMICANPDRIAPRGDLIIYTAGSLAEQYHKMGGTVYYYGKPHAIIYEQIFTMFPEIDKKRIIAIGDSVETDIEGANNAGIDSILVMSGLPKTPDQIAQSGASFILSKLYW
jgi:HAD superfamily hydrolase (TIGR01459 family)